MPSEVLTRLGSHEEQRIIPEKEFAVMFSPYAGRLLALTHVVERADGQRPREFLDMGFLAHVIKHASDVEHLLDRYRAKNNRNWIYFRELAATVKNFAKAAFLLGELGQNAHPKGLFQGEEADFTRKAEAVSRFFSGVILRSFGELRKEARRLGLEIPQGMLDPYYGVKLRNEIILPHTMEGAFDSDMADTVKKIAHRFVEYAEEAQTLQHRLQGSPVLASHVPEIINEGTLRRLSTGIHNLISWYDSHLSDHGIELQYVNLKPLREVFSTLLGLCKISTILAHYFERHLLATSAVMERLGEVVPAHQLMEESFRFTLHFSAHLIQSGKSFAESILSVLVENVTYELPIPKDLGFHARPSTRVSKVVRHHGAEVKMLVDDQVFDAGSILEMLSGGGYIMTKRLDRVLFRGDKRALDDLRVLAQCNYGETREGKDFPLPESLSYLK